jgi:hypothetical protein
MDELMIRFVYNLHRNEKLDTFEQTAEKLSVDIPSSEPDFETSRNVHKAMVAMRDLVS